MDRNKYFAVKLKIKAVNDSTSWLLIWMTGGKMNSFDISDIFDCFITVASTAQYCIHCSC